MSAWEMDELKLWSSVHGERHKSVASRERQRCSGMGDGKESSHDDFGLLMACLGNHRDELEGTGAPGKPHGS